MSDYGEHDPRNTPPYRYYGALELDYTTAERAETSRQHYSVMPRWWYIAAVFRCDHCRAPFSFGVAEQRLWYEELQFWIDSTPKQCVACRRDLRERKALQQEYDRDIAAALSDRSSPLRPRMIEILDRLLESGDGLPERMLENRRHLADRS